MKLVRYFIVVVAAGFLLSSNSYAWRGEGKKGPGGVMFVERLQQELKLTDEQANKIFSLLPKKEERGKCKELETFTAIRDCKMAERKKIDEQISSVLTDEQKKLFEERKSELRHDGPGFRGFAGHCPKQCGCACSK